MKEATKKLDDKALAKAFEGWAQERRVKPPPLVDSSGDEGPYPQKVARNDSVDSRDDSEEEDAHNEEEKRPYPYEAPQRLEERWSMASSMLQRTYPPEEAQRRRIAYLYPMIQDMAAMCRPGTVMQTDLVNRLRDVIENHM